VEHHPIWRLYLRTAANFEAIGTYAARPTRAAIESAVVAHLRWRDAEGRGEA